ncbi:hypothetical protein C8Q80DRAFT_1121228 [Daedaleopsis nitida]|nr:hypothetical protein C8Q80DRAFT_1121228 [Daedaleopsis nitida]
MAPIHSKICTINSSPYFFSATRKREKAQPTLVELVAPSPPHRVGEAQPTVTRVFNKRALKQVLLSPFLRSSLLTLVWLQGQAAPEEASQHSYWCCAFDHSFVNPWSIPAHRSEDTMDLDDESSLPSLTPSPPSSPSLVPTTPPAVVHARTSLIQETRPPILRNNPPASSSGRSAAPLTRSASRTSVKSATKSSKKHIEEDILKRLEESGGIVTRYGEQRVYVLIKAKDGDPVFIRDNRVTSTTERDIVTYFWESFTMNSLRQPPDLSSYVDLCAGDIYCNKICSSDKSSLPTVQLWIWTVDNKGDGSWKRATEGEQRDDGRRLTITPQRQQPSWVSHHWALKQLRNPKGR